LKRCLSILTRYITPSSINHKEYKGIDTALKLDNLPVLDSPENQIRDFINKAKVDDALSVFHQHKQLKDSIMQAKLEQYE
jgi:hypothetical protein